MAGLLRVTSLGPGIIVISPADNPADAPAGIVRIAPVAGDEMTVAVHHSLAGSGADVIPDVISRRLQFFIADLPAFFDKIRDRQFLLRGQ